MTQAQLLNFGLRVYHNSTFTEMTSKLQPLWQSFEKRKLHIPFSAEAVAKMLVHDKYIGTLITKLEASQTLFTKRISQLKSESKNKQNDTQSTENMNDLIEKSKSLKMTINFIKKQFGSQFVQLRQVQLN